MRVAENSDDADVTVSRDLQHLRTNIITCVAEAEENDQVLFYAFSVFVLSTVFKSPYYSKLRDRPRKSHGGCFGSKAGKLAGKPTKQPDRGSNRHGKWGCVWGIRKLKLNCAGNLHQRFSSCPRTETDIERIAGAYDQINSTAIQVLVLNLLHGTG